MSKGPEHLMYNKRLKLLEEKLKGILSISSGKVRKVELYASQWCLVNRVRINGHKLKYRKFYSNIRLFFFFFYCEGNQILL